MRITDTSTYIAYAFTQQMAAFVALRVRAYRKDGTEVIMATYSTGNNYVRFTVEPMDAGEWLFALEGDNGTAWQVIETVQGVRL